MFYFFLIFKKILSNFGDSATWFGCFITVSALAVAYWQLIYSKKENEPNLIVADGAKQVRIKFGSTDFENIKDDFYFQIVNVGKGSAINIQIEVNKFEKFQRKIKKLTPDFDVDENWIYVGLKRGEYHLRTVGSYSLSVQNFLSSDASTNIRIPEFYLYLLKNYFCDTYLKIKREKKDEVEKSNILHEAIRNFPSLEYRINYTNIDQETKQKYFKIDPFATLISMDGDIQTQVILFEFVIKNINDQGLE